jgi:hypothetical protein
MQLSASGKELRTLATKGYPPAAVEGYELIAVESAVAGC